MEFDKESYFHTTFTMIFIDEPCVLGYTGPGTTWDEMNFVMNPAPGAGQIAQPVDLQSSAIPLYHGYRPSCPKEGVQTFYDTYRVVHYVTGANILKF